MNTKHRVSLDLARKLKDAGYPQECDAYWEHANLLFCGQSLAQGLCYNSHEKSHYAVAAPCVGALGEELNKFKSTAGYWEWAIFYTNNSNECEFVYVKALHDKSINTKGTEANARALMWLELKERGLL